MNGVESLKLTAYFGERQRSGGRFLADEMLELYGRAEVSTSIMMRGVAGFRARHHLRTDQLLSLSEDPPVTAVAVDSAPLIETLLDPLIAMTGRGLITLERARLVRGEPIELTGGLHEETKLTVYLGRKEKVYGVPAYLAVCDLMRRRGLAGASVFLGVDGTNHGRRTRAKFFDRNVDVPLMVIAVGTGERMSRLLPELGALLRDPMITVERVRICKRDGALQERPHALPSHDRHGLPLWQKLMVHTSEAATHDGRPIHRALIAELRRRANTHGATVLRGIWGFHDSQEPHGDKLFALTRHVPALTIIIDTPQNIAASFDIVDEVTGGHGLVTSEMVPARLLIDGDGRDGGLKLARHRY
ncbi:DUF190 domain-containing protein [Mycolicibacterium brumae]|uniref:DUF190 domain-containing protein n=1 Tax=Mycolicibacterium brumae TaxID=85968 RepID=UPI000A919E92|nr:DUF190 domain-containing protein [Mycolicibacterium brumae]RWA17872.1 hypothetical protein MBRU_18275 [Mycolicibacterium brumae DSM 44177]UWW09322.1 DUF190 domain-containing protein [Mycolicibacterium brumae]